MLAIPCNKDINDDLKKRPPKAALRPSAIDFPASVSPVFPYNTCNVPTGISA